MNAYWIAAILLLIVMAVLPPVIRKLYYKTLMADLDTANYQAFEKDLDSLTCKLFFSAHEREAMRLSMFEMQGDLTGAEKQLHAMESMRLSRKQKASLAERGFYVYLEQGKVKKAEAMVKLLEENGTPQQIENVKIQYSILLKKESRYIDAIEARLSKMQDASGSVQPGLENQAGTFQYLIGLQYSYRKDIPNTRLWLEKARKNLLGTPWIEDIDKILAQFPASTSN